MYRTITKIAGSFIIIISIIITATWLLIAQQTKDTIKKWANNQIKNDIKVNWERISIDGYPININVEINKPHIVAKNFNSQIIWNPTFITLNFSPIKPRVIKYYSSGLHALNIVYGTTKWSSKIILETLKGEILLKPQKQFREKVHGEFTNLRFKMPHWEKALEIQQGKFDSTVKTRAFINPKSLHPYKNSFSLNLSAQNIKITNNLPSENTKKRLGNTLEKLSFELAFNGYLDTQAIDNKKLIRWRNAGGSLDVNSIFLKWGSIQIYANGTLALDENLQPIGTFVTQIISADKLVNGLIKSGALSKNNSILIQMALAALTRESNENKNKIIEIPITLHNSKISIGPISLLKLPIIIWPEIHS